MDVRVTLDPQARPAHFIQELDLHAGLKTGTLSSLFETLSKHHPDLAPLLENATHQNDLVVFVNNHPIPLKGAEQYELHDGDHVALTVRRD